MIMACRGSFGWTLNGEHHTCNTHWDSNYRDIGHEVLSFAVCAMKNVMDKKNELFDYNALKSKISDEICWGKFFESEGYFHDFDSLKATEARFEEADQSAVNRLVTKLEGLSDRQKYYIPDFSDNGSFICESARCYNAYLLNLDKNQMEFYLGFQLQPQDENINTFYAHPSWSFWKEKQKEKKDVYYPCRLGLILPFEALGEAILANHPMAFIGKFVEKFIRKEQKLSQELRDCIKLLEYYKEVSGQEKRKAEKAKIKKLQKQIEQPVIVSYEQNDQPMDNRYEYIYYTEEINKKMSPSRKKAVKHAKRTRMTNKLLFDKTCFKKTDLSFPAHSVVKLRQKISDKGFSYFKNIKQSELEDRAIQIKKELDTSLNKHASRQTEAFENLIIDKVGRDIYDLYKGDEEAWLQYCKKEDKWLKGRISITPPKDIGID